ncbi:unnamed protein product [Pleuronectes platessa]|uniref:Uncharacterized protein n=1 Tax=Pleuronectes platessa TaxID=8262 RepID=A0A9N7TW55_PLEPL|nr:unnamed protein product [Pleuronectes platessa]
MRRGEVHLKQSDCKENRTVSGFFFRGGGPLPVASHGVAGEGAFFLLESGAVSIRGLEGRPLEGTGYGGRRQRLWARVGPFSRITSATAPAGEPSVRAEGPLRLAPSS